MKKTTETKLLTAIGAAIATLAFAPAQAANPFAVTALPQGYMVAQADKAKDAKCGGDAKAAEAKCGEAKAKDAKCGGDAKAKDAKCGGAKKVDTKAKDGKCGEGKCGSAK